MEKPLPEPAPSAAAEEVAERFRSLVDPDDVASIRQTTSCELAHSPSLHSRSRGALNGSDVLIRQYY